jgi:predicted metal-dependent phosphoesterase TrpH
MNLIKFETHCHSDYSADSNNKVEEIIRVARQRGIGRLVISDHNCIDGALKARKMAPELIIVGEEIMTTQGELLAFFVQELVPAGLPSQKAIELLRQQNAFISVSHPFDRLRHGWELKELNAISPLIDAVEVFNARCLAENINDKALAYAQSNHLLGTVGSDAHTLIEVGRSVLLVAEFHDADSLRLALPQAGKITRYSGPMVRLGSTYASVTKKMRNLN